MSIQSRLNQYRALYRDERADGAPAGELVGLSRRMGELFAALHVGGSMADKVNQPGYDVVGLAGERISVKTVQGMAKGKDVPGFNLRMAHLVDRVIVVCLDPATAELSIIHDEAAADFLPRLNSRGFVTLHALTH